MSRAYCIQVSESVERVIYVEDGVCGGLELLPVLPPARLGELLALELLSRGFTKNEKGDLVRDEEDGTRVSIEPSTGSVSVTLSRSKDVSLTKERTTRVAEETEALQRDAAAKALRGELENELKETERTLGKEAAESLEKRLHALRPELAAISNRVTSTALKEKAASLGNIQEMSEDEAGNLTIKVRL